jgi:membrane associated rhomboid family serine protease
MTSEHGTASGREPLFNAPWPAVAIVAAILGSYLIQGPWLGDAAALTLGFAPADLDHGKWWTMFTVMLVHANWAHAITNALGALAFGPPVARLLGESAKGVVVFFLFYLLCSAISCLGFAVLHLHDPGGIVGASGAVSGLMGAAARLIGRLDGLGPIRSRPVVSLSLAWVATNVLFALATPIIPFMPGAHVAWEAHIAGFAAGLLLIGPFARVVGRTGSR